MSQLVCCYLACEQGGTVGGKSSSHSLLFSPHPQESSLACYLLPYFHLSSSLSLFQHIFVSFVTISPVSSFQGHVACQNFTLTVPPLAVEGTMKLIHPPEGQLTKGSNAHYFTLQESESPVGIL